MSEEEGGGGRESSRHPTTSISSAYDCDSRDSSENAVLVEGEGVGGVYHRRGGVRMEEEERVAVRKARTPNITNF